MSMKRSLGASAVLCAAVFSSAAYAQASADDANKSSNPLNLAPSFNFQDYTTPSLFGVIGHTNDLLLRPTVPVGPLGPIGMPQVTIFAGLNLTFGK
jgi:hypothetical protein